MAAREVDVSHLCLAVPSCWVLGLSPSALGVVTHRSAGYRFAHGAVAVGVKASFAADAGVPRVCWKRPTVLSISRRLKSSDTSQEERWQTTS